MDNVVRVKTRSVKLIRPIDQLDQFPVNRMLRKKKILRFFDMALMRRSTLENLLVNENSGFDLEFLTTLPDEHIALRSFLGIYYVM